MEDIIKNIILKQKCDGVIVAMDKEKKNWEITPIWKDANGQYILKK